MLGPRPHRVHDPAGHGPSARPLYHVPMHAPTALAAPPTRRTSVGDHLRHWRQLRRLSQLDLAADAELSTRHLSCVETGRASPSRDMVLRLVDRLEVPLRERNALLEAAGRKPGQTTASDLGFFVGPRINAAGRLDDIMPCIRRRLCQLVGRGLCQRSRRQQHSDTNNCRFGK